MRRSIIGHTRNRKQRNETMAEAFGGDLFSVFDDQPEKSNTSGGGKDKSNSTER